LESVKETIIIDIATGDPIVPGSIDYQYKCLFSGKTLHFQAYNFETILAEKLQTVLARGVLNGRSKDFFDIYLIHSLRWEEIDRRVLKEAFSATCAYRHTLFSNAEAKAILRRVEDDLEMSRRWESYRRKNKFVGDVAFRETIEAALLVLKEACPS
ncbi:MAG: nucleotidyl transferase AbiEii/AbiGii toxin family protein, partial [Bacilli bacterium]|nr:nucleotidyl transferase AbiEii/AbiGii toxin family protein [Bacilli bacterium]